MFPTLEDIKVDMDLMQALLTGLDDTERSKTTELIKEQINTDRTAALEGHPERQVDVGTRPRARRSGAPAGDES